MTNLVSRAALMGMAGLFATAGAGSSPAVTVAPVRVAKAETAIVKVHRRGARQSHHVDAPFTHVETGRKVAVEAPFTSVYVGKRGRYVRAPFVSLWIPR